MLWQKNVIDISYLKGSLKYPMPIEMSYKHYHYMWKYTYIY